MRRRGTEDLGPRDGRTLMVLAVARISGCQNQKELSLEDQVDHVREEVADLYDGPSEFEVVATRGKGERLDRPELADVERLLRSRRFDLLVMEDVGRLVRGVAAVEIWGIAVDHGTRCIAPNDCLDSSDECWEEDLIAACRDHVGHNAHTSKRLKKKLMNRFRKSGAATALPICGYVKPNGASSYDDWFVDETLRDELVEAGRRLMRTLNYTDVADHLNGLGVPTGPYCSSDAWTGDAVKRQFANPLMKGMPQRGGRHTVKHHQSGRRVSVRNPAGPINYVAPHLAILDPDEFDDLQARLADEHGHLGRRETGGPFSRGPRSRTRFPGQHARCWYCGRRLVWGANGRRDALMCGGSREHRCWNSIGVPGPLLVRRVVERIARRLDALEGFDETFAELVESIRRERSDIGAASARLTRDRQRLDRERENLVAAIAAFGPRAEFAERLTEYDRRRRELETRGRRLEDQTSEPPSLPASVAELRREFDESLQRLSPDSWELALLLRRLVPEILAHNVRACDETGHLLPRVRVTLDLAEGMPNVDDYGELASLLRGVEVIDLFEPVDKEVIRAEVVRLAADLAEPSPGEIAAAMTPRPRTKTVSEALKLERVREELRLDSAYQLVLEPPENYTKLKRHRHRAYRFEREAGYSPPPL